MDGCRDASLVLSQRGMPLLLMYYLPAWIGGSFALVKGQFPAVHQSVRIVAMPPSQCSIEETRPTLFITNLD